MATPPTKFEVFIDGAKDSSPAGRERLAQALSSHYGLPVEQAKRVVAGGHFRVKRDVELQMARRYISHLEGLGARASLVESGPRAATTSSPDLRAAARAAAAPPPAAARAAAVAAAPAPAGTSAAVAPPARAPVADAPAPPRGVELELVDPASKAAVPDEFGISISGLMSDDAAVAPAAPAAVPAAAPKAAAAAPAVRPPGGPKPVPATVAPPPRPPAPTKPAAAAPPPPARAPAAPPPAAEPGDFSVVTLDGAGEGALELERGEAPSGASAFAPPDGAGDEFLPPDERSGGLELALDIPGKSGKVAKPAAPITELNAPIEEVPLSDEKLTASRAAQSFGLEEAPPPAGSKLHAAPPPRPAAPPPVAPAGPSARPTPAPAPWPSTGGAASRAATVPVGGLFGGRIRQNLAARVLLGVALSVALSFLPASLYASHAHSTTIRALQHEERELSEKPPSSTAQERTPAVIREEIGAARTRAFVVTLFIWVTLAAVLGFLWFRFV